MEAAPHPWPALGVLLMRDGLVSKEDLEAILSEQHDSRQQRISGRRLGEILVDRGVVAQQHVDKLVAEQYELPFLDFDLADIDLRAATTLSEEDARRFSALPISMQSDGSYLLAIADPGTVVFSDELRRLLGSVPRFAVVGPRAIDEAITFVHDRPPEPIVREEQGGAAGTSAAAVEYLPGHEPTPERTGDAEAITSHKTPAQLWPPLGALLARDGLVTEAELETALAQQRLSTSQRLGEILVERGVVTRAAVARLIAEQYELEYVELDELAIDPSTARLLPREVALRYPAVPIAGNEDGSLNVAIADPTNLIYSDELHDELGAPVTYVVASPDAIEALLASVHSTTPAEAPDHVEEADAVAEIAGITQIAEDPAAAAEIAETVEEPPGEIAETVGALPIEIDEYVEPRVALLDELDPGADDLLEGAAGAVEPDEPEEATPSGNGTPVLGDGPFSAVAEAVASGASAIHISPHEEGFRVRARVDGLMRSLGTVSPGERASLVEALTGDGAMRVSVTPTKRGEKVTLQAHEPEPEPPTSLDELGLEPKAEEALRDALTHTGAVLVSGPAGSGITTTLYAALDVLNEDDRVVATIEDSVERLVDGVDQLDLGDVEGMTTAEGLGALRDADTDVILVGELSDRETAQAAFACAAEGRVVLAGLPGSDTASAICRLLDLGLEPDALASGLTCVVSQRLVRVVCSSCRETYYASEAELAELGQALDGNPRLLARGRGCRSCGGTGFRGSKGVFEVLTVTDEVRALVSDGAPVAAIEQVAVEGGMRTLRDEGLRLCLDGITTTDEVARILGNAD